MQIKEFIKHKDGLYILEKVLKKDKTWMFLNDNLEVPKEAIKILGRVKEGYPIEYIFEEVWFYGDKFYIKEGVLIPRDDTEVVVERAIKLINEKCKNKSDCLVVDCCTGSGVIAIEIAKHTNAKVIATDISDIAIEVARKNIMLSGVEGKVEVLKCDLLECKSLDGKIFEKSNILKSEILKNGIFESDILENDKQNDLFEKLSKSGLSESEKVENDEVKGKNVLDERKFIKGDILISNPPYVENSWKKPNDYEPDLAFYGGEDGLDIVKRLILQAKNLGYKAAVIEIGYNQKEKLSEFLEKVVKKYEFFNDLGGNLRGVEIEFV